MAYVAPYIDYTGIHIPSYSDILDHLLSSYKGIYGQDCYLGNDAADYQWISVVANVIYDSLLVLQDDYNSKSPTTGLGVALDTLVKVNGITRKAASFSTCTVTLTGVAYTIISNGMTQDVNGNYWALPQVTVIGSDGSVSVTATCQTEGAIAALIGTITVIATPQYGWSTVTNSIAAVTGQSVETDEQLRARQALSTQLASHTMLSGTAASIGAVENVTRYKIYENNTDLIDENFCPPHSITCIVEGGTDEEVATAIFLNRGIGCYTYGGESGDAYSVEEMVTDPDTGDEMAIRFLRPKPVPIYVDVTIKALTGYVSSITTDIETAIYDYLNGLEIGQGLTMSAMYAAVMAMTPDIRSPLFYIDSLEIGVTSSTGTSNITINFDEVTQGILDESPPYIVVTVTT